MTTIRRCLAACLLVLGFMTLGATSASAQVDVRYTGVAPPTITATGGAVGGVLGASGQRAGEAQVLASQVSSGGVAGTAQASVQGLAFTGADILGLVTVGFVAIMIGIVLTRNGRSRSLAKQ